MAGAQNILSAVSRPAGADLSALQFTAVKLATGNPGTVVSATANTDRPFGLLQNKPTSGQAAEVCVLGPGKGKAGGTITAGDRLTQTTGGALITTTTDKHTSIGYAMEDAVSGDYFEVFVNPGYLSV